MLDQSTPSDEVLLQGVAAGDRRAFELLYDRHVSTAYGLILRIVRDRTLADDILQDTFWQVWRRAAEYRGEGKVAAWLYRIARNRSLDELRRQQRSTTESVESFDQWTSEPVAGSSSGHSGHPLLRQLAAGRRSNDAARQFTQEQSHRHVHEALSTIPAEQRVCLELAYFDGMSQQQIADHVKLPIGTVKNPYADGIGKTTIHSAIKGIQARRFANMSISKEQILEMLPSYVLGALESEEMIAVDAYLDEQKELLHQVQVAEDALGLMALATPPVRPPVAIKDTLIWCWREALPVSCNRWL